MDSDGNKVLSLKELTDGIRELGLQADAMSDAEIKAVFEALDFCEQDGSLTYAELIKVFSVSAFKACPHVAVGRMLNSGSAFLPFSDQ